MASGCPFCNGPGLASRLIHDGPLVRSFLSRPRLRAYPGHLLVIPVEHYTTVADLPDIVAGAMQREVGRLIARLRDVRPSFSHLTFSKEELGGVKNGIRQDHIHHHILPMAPSAVRTTRLDWADGDFCTPSIDELALWAGIFSRSLV